MLRLLITVPFLLVLIVFSACNQDPIQIWLLDWGWKSSVGVLTLIVAASFFILGAVSVWFAELRQRGRARRAEQQVRTLEEQIAELRRQQAETHMPVTPPPAMPRLAPQDVPPP
jgi:lipopolysaccharide assembly protein A